MLHEAIIICTGRPKSVTIVSKYVCWQSVKDFRFTPFIDGWATMDIYSALFHVDTDLVSYLRVLQISTYIFSTSLPLSHAHYL